MEEQKEVQVQESKRPVFLTVLCILTFVGSGLGLLFSLIGLVAAGAIETFAATIGMADIVGAGVMKTIITIVLFAGSIYGAIQMLKLKKLGFFIYAVAQVVLLIMGFSIWSLVFTAGFIVMYGLNLKAME